MRNRIFRWVLAALLLAPGSSHLLAQQRNLTVERADARISDKRVALVIGNSDYQATPLKNPVNDAKDMAAKLRNLGFEVVERTNLKARQIGSTLREFRSKLVPGGVAVVFYAGHGLQFRGENYLPAVDSDIGGEEDLPNQSLAVRQIMEILDDVKTRLNLVFLDACRNNPYARRFRSANDGLARVTAPEGTLISFATRPGSVAADGSGRNGLYTGALLEQMDSPNQPIEQMLKRVVTGVKVASNGRQEPWMEGSIEGEFCFGECASLATAASRTDYDAAAYELAFWDSIKASGNPDDFKAYLEQYPKGRFAPLARNRLAAGVTSASATLAIAPSIADRVRTPIAPTPAVPAVPTGGGVSLDDIAKQQESRAQWDRWQIGMKADFDKILALNAAPDLQAAAWERFLGSYAQDNPYSGEDAELRAEAIKLRRAAEAESAKQKEDAERRRHEAAQVALATTTTSAIQQTTPASTISSAGAGRSFRDCDVCPEMVVIPVGSFVMGSPRSEPGRVDNEGPQHDVTISRAFAAGKYEVTFDEWDACVHEGGCATKADDEGWGRGRRPVINVSWHDAKQYTAWLSRKTGKNYRLLSEAEWEYVARAGTTTPFHTGATINPTQANYDTKVAYAGSPTATDQGKTVPVGSYAPNAFNLHDVHGNVEEWVEDCWNENYFGAPSDGSAWTSGVCFKRVLRGGSWNVDPGSLRAALRKQRSIPSFRYSYIGLRAARTD